MCNCNKRHSKYRPTFFYGPVMAVLLLMLSALPVESQPIPGQVVVDPVTPSWLRYHDGGPFFLAGPGDPEGFLYRGSRNVDGTRDGDQLQLIQKLSGTGANSIYLQAIRSHGGDGNSTHNPFIDNDPALGLSEPVLAQWEDWFTEMDQNGITVFFFFYDDGASVWNTGHEVGPEETAFIQQIVNRFEHLHHLIWVIAEEYQEAFSAQRISNIAQIIRAADDHGHAISIHKTVGLEFGEFADDPWIDQFAIQHDGTTAAALHDATVSAWNEADGRYNLNLAEAPEWGTGATARQKAWAIALGGAYVMVLGMNIDTTPLSDLEDLGRLVDFMESTDFPNMQPRDDLAAADTRYVLANEGQSYIAYAISGSGALGIDGMSAGTYRLQWLDTSTGAVHVDDNMQVATGQNSWNRPSGIGSEAALYVVREGESADTSGRQD